ncbi:MAG: hypothetical protein Q9213_004829 [Squamulea squamosa]
MAVERLLGNYDDPWEFIAHVRLENCRQILEALRQLAQIAQPAKIDKLESLSSQKFLDDRRKAKRLGGDPVDQTPSQLHSKRPRLSSSAVTGKEEHSQRNTHRPSYAKLYSGEANQVSDEMFVNDDTLFVDASDSSTNEYAGSGDDQDSQIISWCNQDAGFKISTESADLKQLRLARQSPEGSIRFRARVATGREVSKNIAVWTIEKRTTWVQVGERSHCAIHFIDTPNSICGPSRSGKDRSPMTLPAGSTHDDIENMIINGRTITINPMLMLVAVGAFTPTKWFGSGYVVWNFEGPDTKMNTLSPP